MNNTPFIRNHFFEQEFYDLQRVEVLRGPQGTLYGRNATAGVVNVITAKPKFVYEAKLSGDVANYGSTRFEGMINIPLVEDKVALRLAGAWTKRDGFVQNEISGNPIDGRDLWSTRATLRFEPNDRLSANLIWEHFQEDDDRLRSGKQVCKRDDRTEIQGHAVPPGVAQGYANMFNQSCLPASMYADESYQAPNGFALPYYHPLADLGFPAVFGLDPYASTTQSHDLRVIESTVDPQYRAKADVGELQINFDLSDTLTLTSETAYSADMLFSMEDFNRFNTTSGAFGDIHFAGFPDEDLRKGILQPGPNGNVFCDPQIGCADRLVGIDLSTAKSRQFSQEFRLGSNYDGPFNFSVGANFLRYDTEDKYYVFINSLSLYSLIGWDPYAYSWPNQMPEPYRPGVTDNHQCLGSGPIYPDPNVAQGISGCIYMDPNPITSLNDQGHNYFLSKNPYKLISYAVFGEAYYDITDQLKLTAGLRWTVDRKEAPRIPSWLLGAGTLGYPVAEVIKQEWREPTGRLTLDWKVNSDNMLYASYAHGYKAGGANPPSAGIVSYGNAELSDTMVAQSATHPKTFAPEFVDAFEVGTKNTLLDGKLTLNAAAFFYDYEGYQISYIVDRSAVNLNFDAKIWGLEFEADWRPMDNLRLGLKGGYEKTRVADGMQAIDVMDRTAGNPDWVTVRPFPVFPSNCIVPLYTLTKGPGQPLFVGQNVFSAGNPGPCEFAYGLGLDPLTGLEYKENPTTGSAGFDNRYPGYIGFDPLTAPNHGEGFYKQLGGNELPNAPRFTGTLTADYTLPLPGSWLATLHGDLHYQGESWARIFNTPGYDKLKANTNINLAAIFTNEDAGWTVMAYVKNVQDKDSITGAFLNSDDSGLTTNVFLNEPRLYGLRVTKEWTGDSWVSSLFERRDRAPGAPYPFWVEIGGSIGRLESDNERVTAPFMEEYQPSLVFPLDVQDRRLDTSDQREMKLTYAPGGGWRVSGAVRYGRANGSGRQASYVQLPGANWTLPFIGVTTYHEGPLDYGVSTVSDGEEHTIADFAVGKDIGLGAWGEGGQSSLSLGVRYAQFKSRSAVSLIGTPDWYWPDLANSKYRQDTHTEYATSLNSERAFKGAGPVLSWDAAKQLFGDDASGHVNVDWNISGGVLFGKQTLQAEGNRYAGYSHVPHIALAVPITDTVYNAPISLRRSKNATVPTLDLSLGVSYAIDRVKVSTGYHWERYFDAIDGGYKEAKSYDRGFDGPYLKLSLGFGG
jgi:outer membrane receptor protein involved in Fe transport